MYQKHFHFNAPPFESTPDPRFFFASEQHREALAAIEYTIRMRKGFMMVTGEVGAGKTTVVRTMLERCRDRATIVPVMHGHQTPEELLRQVNRVMGLNPDPDLDRSELLDLLHEQLTEDVHSGRPVVMLVDEAQTLSDAALEQLRLLSNFDTATQRLVQVVLVGQTELRARIASAGMTALRQRIVMAKHIDPLSAPDTAAYIRHRLRVAGAEASGDADRRPDFTLDAVRAIFRHSQGIPRLINHLCDNCLLLAMVRETRAVDDDIVQHVLRDMSPQIEPSTEAATFRFERQRPRLNFAGSL